MTLADRIEAVARAICEADKPAFDKEPRWDKIGIVLQAQFRGLAKAAIAALASAKAEPVAKTYPRMTWAASHKHTCNLCHMDKTPADGCNCGAELIDLIRSEMMSDEHPISDWETQFAEKIKALPMFASPPRTAEQERADAVRWLRDRWAWKGGTSLEASLADAIARGDHVGAAHDPS